MNDNEINETSPNATVIGKGLDCGNSYLIKFDDDFSGLPEYSLNNTFYEINLPNEFKIEGTKIYVEFREPENEELMDVLAAILVEKAVKSKKQEATEKPKKQKKVWKIGSK